MCGVRFPFIMVVAGRNNKKHKHRFATGWPHDAGNGYKVYITLTKFDILPVHRTNSGVTESLQERLPVLLSKKTERTTGRLNSKPFFFKENVTLFLG